MKKTYSGLKVQQYVGQLAFSHDNVLFDDTSSDTRLMRNYLIYVDAMIEDLLPDSVESHRRYLGWLSSQLVIDVVALGKILRDADAFFKDFMSDASACSSLKCFKRTFRGQYLGYFSPIFEEIDAFLSDRGTRPIRKINTYVNFLRRVNLKGLDLAAVCEEEYLAFEANYPSISPECPLCALTDIITEWFKNFSYAEFLPKHGPGSVAGFVGKLPLRYKYSSMLYDDRLRYFSKYIGNVDEYCPVAMRAGLVRRSEIVCVPKSLITNRTISREPCSLQYFQQGVRRCIVKHIEAHSVMSKHITLAHQTRSQDLAWEGSIDGSFATIDLSSASDSVSLELVKRMFCRIPALIAGLICTRSDYTVMPSGCVLALRKFAPMGSATCFPIETVVFSACCELAARRSGHKSRYRVYGDDIVIEEELVEQLLILLNQCGFIVNRSKSFSGTLLHNFREACGGEYYDGESVRPLRIPRFFHGVPKTVRDVTADNVASVLAFSNVCFDRGYVTLRNCVLSQLEGVMPNFWQLPFSADGRIGIHTYADCCTNWKVRQRFDVDTVLHERRLPPNKAALRSPSMRGSTWRLSARCLVSVPKYDALRDEKSSAQIDPAFTLDEEEIRLFEWLRRHALGSWSDSEESTYSDYVNPLAVVITDEQVSIRPTCNVLHPRWLYI